ncbi:MAG: BlaI/MecI/CopY family transcriptional regulator [Candidatus Kapabacteria bacterium]|jgi:predicted transcriptional regulator|nr:BlaI/MecI/CopY family transcriptional regulator [Candidatus Kapabacteria bacterium]
MKDLTKAEEQVMMILWQLDNAYVRDIVEKFSEPKPAYNTVSTIIRILEKKGFVSHIAYGNTHEYYALITKDDYRKFSLKNLVNNYFSNSYNQLVSFFAEKENFSLQDLEELKKQIDDYISNKQR